VGGAPGICECGRMGHPCAMLHRVTLIVLSATALFTSVTLAACSKDAPKAAPSASKEAAESAAAKQGTDAAKSPAAAAAAKAGGDARGALIDHEVTDIEGKQVKLSDFNQGEGKKALLIVNTASQCGFTPQYAKLQELYGKYKDDGLVVLGFPSDDYGGQEPGTNEEISSFVASKYSVEFPMMDKVTTKGEGMIPLYRALTEQSPQEFQGPVRWNFTKFLVDADGYVVARFESPVDPLSDEVQAAIAKALPGATK
jgi:glutathione peroxidase